MIPLDMIRRAFPKAVEAHEGRWFTDEEISAATEIPRLEPQEYEPLEETPPCANYSTEYLQYLQTRRSRKSS